MKTIPEEEQGEPTPRPKPVDHRKDAQETLSKRCTVTFRLRNHFKQYMHQGDLEATFHRIQSGAEPGQVLQTEIRRVP